MPTRSEWPAVMERLAKEKIDLSCRKNSNYAGGDDQTDAFHNFRLIEHITHGRVSAEVGLLVRISDKYARLANLITGNKDAVGESLKDTVRDLAVYADILYAMIEENESQELTEYFGYGSTSTATELDNYITQLPLNFETSDAPFEETKPEDISAEPQPSYWQKFCEMFGKEQAPKA